MSSPLISKLRMLGRRVKYSCSFAHILFIAQPGGGGGEEVFAYSRAQMIWDISNQLKLASQRKLSSY